ncbi:MAG: hypothetical protein M0P16_09105 [Syntrophales bacterium]|nr:hypothetical protein [Syntrophales bacterium]MCK9391257.1 hypothetical protein [Syntrophales bacterium]
MNKAFQLRYGGFLSQSHPEINGKEIVACVKGNLRWTRTDRLSYSKSILLLRQQDMSSKSGMTIEN